MYMSGGVPEPRALQALRRGARTVHLEAHHVGYRSRMEMAIGALVIATVLFMVIVLS
jgi:hypothetical protein